MSPQSGYRYQPLDGEVVPRALQDDEPEVPREILVPSAEVAPGLEPVAAGDEVELRLRRLVLQYAQQLVGLDGGQSPALMAFGYAYVVHDCEGFVIRVPPPIDSADRCKERNPACPCGSDSCPVS